MNGGPRCLAREAQFFKVLVEGFTEKLSIPKAFIKKMPEELSGTVILHGPSGNCWPVRLSKTSKGTYLAGGWEAFVKHHSLIEGEFLVFSRVRSMHFDVKIYGKNACERGDTLTVQASLGLTSRQLKKKTQSPRGDEAKFTAKDTFTTKASHGPTSRKEKKKCQSPRRDAGKMASTSNLKALGAYVAARHFANGLVRPHFVSEIKHYFLHTHRYLAVPAFFARKHLKTKVIKLLSPNGREWKMKFYCGLPRCPSRIYCGWVPFAFANDIKEGDSCVFELVQEDTLQMHIFRC